MLKAGETSTVKFNVDVHGTSALPQVRVVLDILGQELGFKCTKIGTEWQAEVKIPSDVVPGQYDMRVEVTLNSRLFVPVKRRVEISGAEQPTVLPDPPTIDIPQVSPQVEPVKAPVMAQAEKPMVISPSLLRQFTPEAVVDINKPKIKFTPKNIQKVKTQVPKKPEPLVIPKQAELKGELKVTRAPAKISKVVKEKREPIKISIADIAAESKKRFDDVLKESASYKKPTVQVQSFNLTPATPVTLVKGEIVYE